VKGQADLLFVSRGKWKRAPALLRVVGDDREWSLPNGLTKK
jgi:hypothetical protein